MICLKKLYLPMVGVLSDFTVLTDAGLGLILRSRCALSGRAHPASRRSAGAPDQTDVHRVAGAAGAGGAAAAPDAAPAGGAAAAGGAGGAAGAAAAAGTDAPAAAGAV